MYVRKISILNVDKGIVAYQVNFLKVKKFNRKKNKFVFEDKSSVDSYKLNKKNYRETYLFNYEGNCFDDIVLEIVLDRKKELEKDPEKNSMFLSTNFNFENEELKAIRV